MYPLQTVVSVFILATILLQISFLTKLAVYVTILLAACLNPSDDFENEMTN